MLSVVNWGLVTEKVALIIVLGLVIYGIFLFITRVFGKQQDSALQILKERFARGEITEEEFEQRRMMLQKE